MSAKNTTFAAKFNKNLPIMTFISVAQYAELYGISERTARNYCSSGKIEGAVLVGKTWNIPADAILPQKGKQKISPLLQQLRIEKSSRLKGGIYHRTQIDLTYNSNHIEGSRLTKEQTRYIFETNTLGVTTENTRIDDIMETVNHFRCIDYVIDHATDKLTETHIKHLHQLLKTNTSDSQKEWFAVGDYKKLANEVGGEGTTNPKEVHKEMKQLLAEYNQLKQVSLDDVLNFHVQFERIHPFQDGNGRIGRLLIFWQCLQNNIIPFIITEDLRLYYYRGIQNWDRINGFLTDTCLTAQDYYKEHLQYFKIKF